MNDDSIAAIVGRGRTVGCVVELQAELFTPGLITRNTTRKGTWFSVGELDGAYTARAREIEALMSHVGGGRTAPIHDHLKGPRAKSSSSAAWCRAKAGSWASPVRATTR